MFCYFTKRIYFFIFLAAFIRIDQKIQWFHEKGLREI